MQGQILDYSIQTNEGVISGEDGSRYTFAGSAWNDSTPPARGMRVDFEVQGTDAVGVYRALGGGGGGVDVSTMFSSSGAKSRVVAGVLAIVLGYLGVHKFYLGNTVPGIIHVAVTGVGIFLFIVAAILSTVFYFGFGAVIGGLFGLLGWLVITASGVVGLVEGIIYLTKSDEEFEARYVTQKRPWF